MGAAAVDEGLEQRGEHRVLVGHGPRALLRDDGLQHLGSGRIVASDTEVPNMLVNLV